MSRVQKRSTYGWLSVRSASSPITASCSPSAGARDATGEGRQATLAQPGHEWLGPRLVAELTERATGPECQRLVQGRQR